MLKEKYETLFTSFGAPQRPHQWWLRILMASSWWSNVNFPGIENAKLKQVCIVKSSQQEDKKLKQEHLWSLTLETQKLKMRKKLMSSLCFVIIVLVRPLLGIFTENCQHQQILQANYSPNEFSFRIEGKLHYLIPAMMLSGVKVFLL